MKIINLLKFILVFSFIIVSFQTARAQYAYGSSRIVYDPITKKVTTTSVTALDYWAGLYYDPAVVGDVYIQGNEAAVGYNYGFAHIVPARVVMQTTNAAPPNTRYDLYSDHYIIGYFTTVIILDDDTGNPTPVRGWYDPLGFSALGGPQNPGWDTYEGSGRREQIIQSPHIYLGTTGVSFITDPPPCSGVTGAVNDSCADDLTVEIHNPFKSEDLAGTTQNALLGADISLSAQASSSSTSPITYQWKVNGLIESDSTGRNYLTYFNKIGNNTITLEVKQGSRTITKSFTGNASIPTLVTNVSDTPNGFFGLERIPLITTPSLPCAQPAEQRWLFLGCVLSLPPKRESQNTAGIYGKAIVAGPDNFISNGAHSWIEFQQIIKPDVRKSGVNSNGRSFTKCLKLPPEPRDEWLNDKSGRDYSGNNGVFGEYKVAGTFKNRTSGTAARITLDFIDSPGILLETTEGGDKNYNYYLKNDFETYVTYFSNAIPDIDFGKDFRKALAKMPWNWEALVKRKGSSTSWTFVGSPKENKNLLSMSIPYDANSSGERQYSGVVGDTYEICSKPLPLTITSRRDVAVWRKTNGVWYVMNSDGTVQAQTQWGVDYDIPVPGDYDGDGRADFAVFRPDNPATPEDECANGCTWYVLKSSDNSLMTFVFGSQGDKAVPADYDGDGKTDFALFRPSNNTWYALRSSDNTYYITQFGQNGDIPVPSDYDGDGIDEVAVWSPTNATWSIRNSSNQQVTTQSWGYSTDIPVIGDYDGDGKTDIANWQSSGNWHILLSGNSQTMDFNFGIPTTDKPVAGDYDGDGITDIAVWRPDASQPSTWYIRYSSDSQTHYFYWGSQGDVPIPAAYNRQ